MMNSLDLKLLMVKVEVVHDSSGWPTLSRDGGELASAFLEQT